MKCEVLDNFIWVYKIDLQDIYLYIKYDHDKMF